MAFLEDLLAGPTNGKAQNQNLVRKVDAPCEPVSVSEVTDFIKPVGSQDNVNLPLLIKGCRRAIESAISKSIIRTQWELTADRVPGRWRVPIRPLLRANSIHYLETMYSTVPVLWASTGYIVRPKEVTARGAWPYHAGYQSLTLNYDAGLVDVPDTPDQADLDAATAAVPSDIKLAILNLIGFAFENREGDGPESAFEHLISLKQNIGELPKSVKMYLLDYMDYTI